MDAIIDFVATNPEAAWMLLGAVLLALEVLGIPGIGLLFGGLGALTLGGLLAFDVLTADTTLIRAVYFGGFTTIWFAVLYRPLKRRYDKGENTQGAGRAKDNFIGAQVTIVEDIAPSETGSARWSGTNMRAKLADDTAAAKKNDKLYVQDVDGNTLILTANKP